MRFVKRANDANSNRFILPARAPGTGHRELPVYEVGSSTLSLAGKNPGFQATPLHLNLSQGNSPTMPHPQIEALLNEKPAVVFPGVYDLQPIFGITEEDKRSERT